MLEKTITNEKKSKREGVLGVVAILLLLAGVSYLFIERIYARFSLASKFDFDAIPTAIEVPPEDLYRVRQPGYALPTRRVKPQSPQLASTSPEPSPDKTFTDINTRDLQIAADSGSFIPVTPPQDNDTEPNVARTSFTDEQQPKTSLLPITTFPDFQGFRPPVPSSDGNDIILSSPTLPNENDSAVKDLVETPHSLNHQATNSVSPSKVENHFEPLTRTVKDLTGEPPPPTIPTFSTDSPSEFSRPFPDFSEELPPILNARNRQFENPLSSFETEETPTKLPESIAGVTDHAELDQMVRVEIGDTLWDLCVRVYGDGRFFRAVSAVNQPVLHGNSRLTPGTELRFSTRRHLINHYRELIPADLLETQPQTPENTERELWTYALSDPAKERNRHPSKINQVPFEPNQNKAQLNSYTTQPDDSLFSIAREQLGQASRYLEILELNRDQLPPKIEHLTPLPAGLPLKLPSLNR